MKLEQAQSIAKELAKQYHRWGKQANPPYSLQQLMQVIAVLDEHGHFDTNVAQLREELTLANRRLAAANARAIKAEKQA